MIVENPDPPIITAQTLRHLLLCERRVWLDAHRDPALRDDASPETLRLYALGTQHERRVHDATTIAIEPITRDLMAQEVSGILGACLEHHTPLDLTDTVFAIRGQVDQLLRIVREGEYSYSPVEIKQRARPDHADWVQLDLYVWLLSLTQGGFPPAELWLGADTAGRPRARLPHEYDEARLMEALTRAAQLLNVPSAPPVRLESHCKDCHWYTACQSVAQQEQRLELLYGVSRTTRHNMLQAGMTTLADVVVLSAEELQQVKGIGPKTAPRIRANAQAWLENRPVWLNPLPEDCHRSGWMFDLETLEAAGRTVPWCMGWCDSDGRTQITLVAPVQLPEELVLPDGQAVILAPDSDSAWEAFAAAVDHDDSPIFHWTGYDSAIMRDTAPTAVRDRLESRLHDLNATLRHVVSLPLKSTSIKPVSLHLGFAWQGYNDWFAAYLDYKYWLETNNLDALTRACMYQRADVQSMAHVWRWLVAEAPTA
jgi:predicted RecB family nuclease